MTIKMRPAAGHGHFACAETAPAPELQGGNETILSRTTIWRDYVLTQLHSLGYVTLDAENATQALGIVKSGRPFDLLTDVIMPGLNGRQLADEILKIKPEQGAVYLAIPRMRSSITAGSTRRAAARQTLSQVGHGRHDPQGARRIEPRFWIESERSSGSVLTRFSSREPVPTSLENAMRPDTAAWPAPRGVRPGARRLSSRSGRGRRCLRAES